MKPILDRKDKRKGSIFDLAPHPSGPLLLPWTREELLDEMRARWSLSLRRDIPEST